MHPQYKIILDILYALNNTSAAWSFGRHVNLVFVQIRSELTNASTFKHYPEDLQWNASHWMLAKRRQYLQQATAAAYSSSPMAAWLPDLHIASPFSAPRAGPVPSALPGAAADTPSWLTRSCCVSVILIIAENGWLAVSELCCKQGRGWGGGGGG